MKSGKSIRNMHKLNFHLVPVTGAAKTNGGSGKFRAEFVRGYGEGNNRGVVDFDGVLDETIAHKLHGVSKDLLGLYVKSVLQTMIDKTVEDGRTRRIDEYLSVGLGISGSFENKTDDYDFDRNKLNLSVRTLAAFRPSLDSIYPENVNRKKKFCLNYITAKDGEHENHQIVFGEDFILRGSGFDMPKNWFVVGMVSTGQDSYLTVDVPVKERSENEIVCGWPAELDSKYIGKSIEVSVGKIAEDIAEEDDKYRKVRASILAK